MSTSKHYKRNKIFVPIYDNSIDKIFVPIYDNSIDKIFVPIYSGLNEKNKKYKIGEKRKNNIKKKVRFNEKVNVRVIKNNYE